MAKATTPKEESVEQRTFLKFTGASVVERVITAADFKKSGIEGSKQVWNSENNHSVDVTEWPQEAIDLVLAQGDFKVEQREVIRLPDADEDDESDDTEV